MRRALVGHLDGLARYPTTAGLDELREAMATWFGMRYSLPRLDPATQVLPVNGTREALFAFAQAVVDQSRPGPVVVCPNPFYQIYKGAALLAGAEPLFLNQVATDGFTLDLESIPEDAWRRTQLVYVSPRRTGSGEATFAVSSCSPVSPNGRTRRGCVRAAWPATPGCSSVFCSIVRITEAR